LSWPSDPLIGIFEHFDPLAEPTDNARNGEHHREAGCWHSDRLVDDSGVEVDIGIELAIDEVLVFKSSSSPLTVAASPAGPSGASADRQRTRTARMMLEMWPGVTAGSSPPVGREGGSLP
jgi:hypothetical protein